MSVSPKLRQKFAFAILFLMGANLLIGSSYRAERDTWISMLITSVIMVLWALVLARISILHPGKDIFALLKVLPKWISYPLIGIVTFYCFSQAVITLRVYSGFVHIVSLPNTGILIVLALICLVVWFFLRNADSMLFRFSYVTLIPIVILVVALFLLLASKFRVENLFPIFYKNTRDVLYCAAENVAFPFGNAFLLLGISFNPENPKKERKTWLWVVVISLALSLIVVLQNLLLLGGSLADELDFPYNFAASLVNVGDFFSRIEVFSSLFFFLSAIVRSAYLMQLVLKGLCHLFPIQKDAMAFPLITLLCGYSAIAFENTNSVFNYLQVFPYIALPLQFGIPLIILFRAIRQKRNKTSLPERVQSNPIRML